MSALDPSQPDRPFHGLRSLWDMAKIVSTFLELMRLIILTEEKLKNSTENIDPSTWEGICSPLFSFTDPEITEAFPRLSKFSARISHTGL